MDRPKNEAFRRVLSETTHPGGSMLTPRGEPGSAEFSKTLYGEDAPGRELMSPETVDPLHVSVEPDSNPFLDFYTDKVGEGLAQSHQQWQDRQRVRGMTMVAAGPLPHTHSTMEMQCTLPFMSMDQSMDMSDMSTLGDVVDTGQKEFTPSDDITCLLTKMLANTSKGVESQFSSYGATPEEVQRFQRHLGKLIEKTKPPIKPLKDPLTSIAELNNAAMKMFHVSKIENFAAKIAERYKIPPVPAALLPPGMVYADWLADQLALGRYLCFGLPVPPGTVELLGQVFGDLGKLAKSFGAFSPQGQQLMGNFRYEAWKEVVAMVVPKQKELVPYLDTASRLKGAGAEFSKIAAGTLIARASGGFFR